MITVYLGRQTEGKEIQENFLCSICQSAEALNVTFLLAVQDKQCNANNAMRKLCSLGGDPPHLFT